MGISFFYFEREFSCRQHASVGGEELVHADPEQRPVDVLDALLVVVLVEVDHANQQRKVLSGIKKQA